MITQTYKGHEYTVVVLPIKEILRDDDFNCRGDITCDNIVTLAEDINKRGLDQPIVVRPIKDRNYKYKIISGHRRYTACRSLNWQEIPCFIRDNCTDTEALAENLVENIEREDLNILQEAKAIQHFASLGYSVAEIAKLVNQGTRWVNIRLGLCILPTSVQEDAAARLIIPSEIEELITLKRAGKSDDDILRLAVNVRDRRNVRNRVSTKLLKAIKRHFEPDAIKIKFRNKDEVEHILSLVMSALQGQSLASMAIAWCACGISTRDFLEYVEQEAKLFGYDFKVPLTYIINEKMEVEKYNIDSPRFPKEVINPQETLTDDYV